MSTATFESVLPQIVPFRIPEGIARLVSRLLGIGEMEKIYEALSLEREGSLPERLLRHLAVTWSTSDAELARVPAAGPAVATVNHPFGILEGAVIAALLARLRPDVRFLANGILTAIPELRDMVIPVDPISGRAASHANGTGLRRALDHLGAGGLLVVFPAGEVSHFRWKERAVADSEWTPAVARIVSLAGRRGARLSVVPIFVAGANSALFQAAGLLHPGFRTALLGRELLNKRGRRVEVRIGSPIPAARLAAMPSEREQADYLRWRTYLLAGRKAFKPHTSRPIASRTDAKRQPVAPEVPANALAAEIATLSPLQASGDLAVYIASAGQIPFTMREIGRLREIAFRAAGEGTGKPLDLDAFDHHYLHLFVWHAKRREIAGAYRLARTDAVPSLYTRTLFRYSDEFLRRIGPSVELGRSFVRVEYQRSFGPLLLLWKGIGAYLRQHPEYKVLFGPVSISNAYQAVSRELMVGFLEKYAWMRECASLVRNRCAFRSRALRGAARPAFPGAGFDVEDLSAVLADLEPGGEGVPVLLRQYLKLGGKLLAFNVDSQFANALDGLILVDLTKTQPKLLERYLGKDYGTL